MAKLLAFFNDALGQVYFAFKFGGVSIDTAVLIPQFVEKLRYFQALLAHSPFIRSLTWVFQRGDEVYRVDRLYLVKNPSNLRWHFDKILDDLRLDADDSTQSTSPLGAPKLFLCRRGLRSISNIDEIELITLKNGYKTVYAEDLEFEGQKYLFEKCERLIAIDGAGITNIVFRRGKSLDVLEIFSKNNVYPCYAWLCFQYVFGYSAILGENELSHVFFFLRTNLRKR